MADRDGPVVNKNANRNSNQNPNQNPNQYPNHAQGNVQDDNEGQNLPPHNPFLPDALIEPWSTSKTTIKLVPF